MKKELATKFIDKETPNGHWQKIPFQGELEWEWIEHDKFWQDQQREIDELKDAD